VRSAAVVESCCLMSEVNHLGEQITGAEDKNQKNLKTIRKKEHWSLKHAHGWEQKLLDLAGKEVEHINSYVSKASTKGQIYGETALREVDFRVVPDGDVFTEALDIDPAPPTTSCSNLDDGIAVGIVDKDLASASIALPLAAANGGSSRSGGGRIGAALPDSSRPLRQPASEVKLVSGLANPTVDSL